MAKIIFADNTNAWDTTNTLCPGGIWWNTSRILRKNAIPNELFLMTAIRLHQRTSATADRSIISFGPPMNGTGSKTAALIDSLNYLTQRRLERLRQQCCENDLRPTIRG